ncbi:MAG: Fic family protein [Chlamydiales bacterium]|nr:Fic family protein [Chlamydiales bacterium]
MIPSFISQFWPSSSNSSNDTEESVSVPSSIGRSIKHIGSCAVTVAKVVGVFGIFVGLSLLPIVPVLGGAIYHNSSHTIAPMLVANSMVTEIPPFPAYTAWFMNPGHQLARNGTTACDITACLERRISCDAVTTIAVSDYESKKAFDSVDQTQTFKNKGIVVRNNTVNQISGRTLHFRINGRKFENYEKALHHIEETIFRNPEYYFTSPKEIIRTIKTLHFILMQNLPDGHILTPGKFRTLEKAITPAISLADVKMIAKRCLSKKDFEIFDASQTAFIDSHSTRIFTPEERKIWNACFFVPISPLEIKQSLKKFAQELSVHIERNFGSSRKVPLDAEAQKLASIKIAAFAHKKIIEIHPVLKGNGLIARLFMNSILRCFGDFDPVIFDSEVGYIDAVKASLKDPKKFTNYLKDHVIPWTEKQRHTLSHTADYMTIYKAFTI